MSMGPYNQDSAGKKTTYRKMNQRFLKQWRSTFVWTRANFQTSKHCADRTASQ